jgi:hypothetical protein
MLYLHPEENLWDVMHGREDHVIDITNLVSSESLETFLPSSTNLTVMVKVADSLGSFANFTAFLPVEPMVEKSLIK